jgi:hypothetical protein
VEAADKLAQLPVVWNPRVGLLNLEGPDSEHLIARDTAFLTAIFGRVRSVDLAEPSCDVLFL